MRYARSLFLPAVSYITRRYLNVTTITVISAIEIGKGLCKRSGKTQPPAYLYFLIINFFILVLD